MLAVDRLERDGFVPVPHDDHLVIPGIRYRNEQMVLSTGDLISETDAAGQPVDHVVYLAGQQCPAPIEGVNIHVTKDKSFGGRSVVCMLSSKPDDCYPGLYEKMVHYITLVSGAWKEKIDQSPSDNTVNILSNRLAYYRSLSSSAGTEKITQILKDYRIGVIGVGGTGSYVLDFIAKLPVAQILICDSDVLLEKNAFRCPGAVTLSEIEKNQLKVEYFANVYSLVNNNISMLPEKIDENNLQRLSGMNFVFVCIDKEHGKKSILNFLTNEDIPFVDVGMAISESNGRVFGALRVTSFTYYSQSDTTQESEDENQYSENLYSRTSMFSELNALNAALAIIRWKKQLGIYVDSEVESMSKYIIGENKISKIANESSKDL